MHVFDCLSITVNVQSIAIERSVAEDLPGQLVVYRGGFREQYKRLIIMSSALMARLQNRITGAYGATVKTRSWSQRNIVALLCLWFKKNATIDLLCRCTLADRSFFRHHRTVNSPWCICQAGRGRGRFLDGPYESFQWWSPALLSARSSLPAPALGSPSFSCYGHFEQLKENKGLGLASTMTHKWTTWSSKQMWMSLDWNKNKRQFEKQQKTLLLVSVFLVTFKRCSKLSSSTLRRCIRTESF